MSEPSPATAQRREAQRLALIEAAERKIAEGGLGAIKARDLAQEIGIALGALYNLVPDLDALSMLVATRTLARLEQKVSAAGHALAATAGQDDPLRRLTVFAHAYREFATDNLNLWRALFDHRATDRRAFSDELIEEQMRLFAHVTAALRLLEPAAGEEALFLHSRTLYGAVHGVVMLGLDEKLAAVPVELLDRQLEILVTAFCKGLSVQEQ